MRQLIFSALAAAFFATPACADACDDLISSVEGALAMNGQQSELRSQLESLLEMGRSAKAKGDVAACQAAITGSMQSPRPGAGGHECESQEKTV